MKTFLETDDLHAIDGYGLVASRGPALAAAPERFDVHLLGLDETARRSVERVCREDGRRVQAFVEVEAMIAFAGRRGPACAVLALDAPDTGGLAAQGVLRERLPHAATLFVAYRADIRSCVEAMRQGAIDVLEQPVDAAVLRRSLALAEASSRARWAAEVRRASTLERLACLTPREREVLTLVMAGRRNKEIAHALASEESTVKVHRSRLMRKLGTRSLADLLSLLQPLEQSAAAAEANRRCC